MEVMAAEKCAICDETVDPGDYRVKRCTECGSWFCYRHLGQYKSQCTLCGTYSLKNLYGR
jgi:DNA-directed RNA polymerase subunit RPC12/RpoP